MTYAGSPIPECTCLRHQRRSAHGSSERPPRVGGQPVGWRSRHILCRKWWCRCANRCDRFLLQNEAGPRHGATNRHHLRFPGRFVFTAYFLNAVRAVTAVTGVTAFSGHFGTAKAHGPLIRSGKSGGHLTGFQIRTLDQDQPSTARPLLGHPRRCPLPVVSCRWQPVRHLAGGRHCASDEVVQGAGIKACLVT